jgi:hypothetical protein
MAMADWIALLRTCHPWSEMVLDDVAGEFRAVLDEVLRTTGAPAPRARAARLRQVARAHGAFRRRQGCPALVLKDELTIAEEAIAIALTRSGADHALVTTVQDSLIPVLRAVERAEYGGYVDVKE